MHLPAPQLACGGALVKVSTPPIFPGLDRCAIRQSQPRSGSVDLIGTDSAKDETGTSGVMLRELSRIDRTEVTQWATGMKHPFREIRFC